MMLMRFQCKINLLLVLLSGFLLVGGCGDFFARKPTEMQSREILEELGKVNESPHTDNPLPEAYRQPPARLDIKGGVKVFYFTKHHPAEDLASLLKQQLAVESTINPSTNQIVADCKNNAQADAVQQYLEYIDVSPIQVNVDCLILERYGNVTMDWETTLLVEDLLTEQRLEDHGLGNILSEERLQDKFTIGELKYPNPVLPGASLREVERSTFGLDFGYWIDRGVEGEQIRAVVDVLVSRGYLKILLNPQLETINGKTATVTIKDYVPIEEVKTGSAGASGVYNITKYVWVENTLSVTPFVFSDGSISLETDIEIGSRSKPEGVVQRSIITKRSIDVDENRIAPGKSLIIGGMRKSEKRSVVRGVPFLKDLPLMGVLFSSKDFEEKGTEIIFILTPSISSGGVENRQVVEEIRSKYEEPEYKKGLGDVIPAPLGKDPYTKVIENEATKAELGRVEAQLDLEQAYQEVQSEKERADRAEAEADKLRARARDYQQQAEQVLLETQTVLNQAHSARSQIQSDQQTIEQLESQKNKIIEQLLKAQETAEKAAEEAEQAREKVRDAQSRLNKAQRQLNNAEQSIQKGDAVPDGSAQ